ncbi:hypothetical protein PIROE2DRAFT_63551 [Piromyces sp. E2]|nr:hypothetical protein PIROE2DRAFT_63551 [Piromyces sp. E2]|eukprot:OUM59797.1 hypothetical protein PIROE2DRAFT_63551 [Piromyces sp. E2]
MNKDKNKNEYDETTMIKNNSKYQSSRHKKYQTTIEKRHLKSEATPYTERTHIRIKSTPLESTTNSNPIKFNFEYRNPTTTCHIISQTPGKNINRNIGRKEYNDSSLGSSSTLTTNSGVDLNDNGDIFNSHNISNECGNNVRNSNNSINNNNNNNWNCNGNNSNRSSTNTLNNGSNSNHSSTNTLNNGNGNTGYSNNINSSLSSNNNINRGNMESNNTNSGNNLNATSNNRLNGSNNNIMKNNNSISSNKCINSNCNTNNNKNEDKANENGYHTKCPNCNTSFDVLPGTEGSIDDKEKDVNDDSDSTLSSHSSLAEIIDKVIASKNRKMKKNNLSNDSLTSIPEELQKKIDKITKKKHLLSKKSTVPIPQEPKKTSNTIKQLNTPPKSQSNSKNNISTSKGTITTPPTKSIQKSSEQVASKPIGSRSSLRMGTLNKGKSPTKDSLNSKNSLDKMISKPLSSSNNSLSSSQKNKSTPLLKSNPKLMGSNAQELNKDPTTSNNKTGSQLLSNPKNNDSSKKGTDSVKSPVRINSKQVSIVSHVSTKQTPPPPQKTSKSNLGSQDPLKKSTDSLGQGQGQGQNSAVTYSIKCDVIPVTSTVHINKSPTISPSPNAYKFGIPSFVKLNDMTPDPVISNQSSQSPEAIIKYEAIPVTSTVHINKYIRSSPQTPGDNISSSNKKTELEIDHISVYPIPFGSQKLHNVPILPISDKYDFDEEIIHDPEENGNANIDENIVDFGQELNDLAHDLPSNLDSGSSDVFLLNETQNNNVTDSKTKLNNPKGSIEKLKKPESNNSSSVYHSKTSLIQKLRSPMADSSIHGSMNPITAQLLKEAKLNKTGSDKAITAEEKEKGLLDEDDLLGGLAYSLVSLGKNSLLGKGSNPDASKKIEKVVSGSVNSLYKKVLSRSINSLGSGLLAKDNVKNSHSNLRNVTTLNYSSSNAGDDKNGPFTLPTTNKIYDEVSDNVIHFIQNQWNQSDGISSTFQFLSIIKNGTDIDNNCNDYLIKPLIEYHPLFRYISPGWLKMNEKELEDLKKTLEDKKNEKRFFVMPWKIEDQAINNGQSYWICIIYDKSSDKYIIFDTKNKDIHAYGVCLMIQSGILKYMFDMTTPFYDKSLQEIIANREQTTLETSANHEGWKQIIICNSGLNHEDSEDYQEFSLAPQIMTKFASTKVDYVFPIITLPGV